MNPLQDRRVLMAGGAGAALLAGVLIAVLLAGHARTPENQTDANTTGALQVQQIETPKLDPDRQLRCFVGGQFVGTATLAECAKKNGVSAQALDVGLDESGALAAGGDQLKPLPPAAAPAPVAIAEPPPVIATPTPPAQRATAECLGYGAEGWRAVGGGLSQSACVQALFAGRCQRPGEALYGRWGGQTLRLAPGKVEASPDNQTFHLLAEQGRDCSIPPL